MNETYIVPGNGDSSTDEGKSETTTAKPNYFGLENNQTHQQFRCSLDMIKSFPPNPEFENTIKGWVRELDSEEREKQKKANRLEKAPGWLERIDNPTPEDFLAMSNYLPFGRQLLEKPIKMIEKIEKATVDQFSGKRNVERFRDINAAIKKAMGKLKDDRDQAMEKRYCTRDILKATQKFTQMGVERSSQSSDQKSEKSEILESLASF